MTISRYPEWLNDVWAKSPDKGAGGKPETLAEHTWRTLQQLSAFVRLRPFLPESIGVPRLWHVLFWAAFLHDFGKAASGFQSVLHGQSKWPHRHEVLSLAFVNWIAAGFTSAELPWVVAAIVSHHKDAAEIDVLYPTTEDDDLDQITECMTGFREQDVKGLWRWLSELSPSWITELGLADCGVASPPFDSVVDPIGIVKKQGAQSIFNSLRTYRRAVRSMNDGAISVFDIIGIAVRGHILTADHSASAHADSPPKAEFTLEVILGPKALKSEDLYAHQRRASTTDGSILLVAPTGSGKTEAALLWAARQAGEKKHLPRLFYTLPYQASMNAMYQRLDSVFPGQVTLQHGRALLATYRMLMERSDYTPEHAAQQARWARNLARLNHPPVRVLSPYQILKGMYRLKGYEALLTDYHGAAFVFDEIHAYDVTRLAMILKTVQYLSQNYGARFIVMSATFPSLIKTRLREALGEPAEITANADLFRSFQRHQLNLLEGEILSDAALEQIEADARAGKSVLVVCNVVARAQTVYEELKSRLQDCSARVALLHGRFNLRDRLTKEQLVARSAGSNSKEREPVVLVATQVVEVSLDVDFDTIHSDPAPLEALIQRFGRVNRRRKQLGLATVNVYREPVDGQHVYDPVLVNRTIEILARENQKAIDENCIGAWLDEIYSGQVAEKWTEQYDHAAREFEDTCIRTLHPFHSDETLEDLFYRAFDGVEVLPWSLVDEYQRLKEDEPIRANELLVSISWGRYHALANEGLLLPRDVENQIPPVAQAPYSEEVGLTFEIVPDAGDDL